MSNNGQRIFAGQYQLDVQIASSLSSPMWRAMDLLLKRWVTLVLLPTSDLRSVKLLQECQAAAANDRRDVIAILDVIASGIITGENSTDLPESYVGIVFEWLDGESLNQLLIKRGEVFDVEQALHQVGVIANTLAHSHSLNIFHGRLRPHNLIFSEGQNVRVSGFGLDSALMGADSTDGVQQDIKGIGNLLFVMVTGMWPMESVDSLPAARATVGANLVLPSEVHGGIRSGIDQIYRRTQIGEFSSMRQVIDALSVGEVEVDENLQARVTRFTASSVTWHPESGTSASRLKVVAIAALTVGVFGWIGWQLLTNNFQTQESVSQNLSSPQPSIEVSVPVGTGEIAQITGISTYDPFGDDTENEDLAQLAIDGDSQSAWTTVEYRLANMGKSGVGLILDLGTAQLVTRVDIEFNSTGQSAEVYVVDTATPDFATAAKIGETAQALETAQVNARQPTTGRYVVVWLTPDLPKLTSGKFQGGIAEITVIR
jgi:serine/threonine protein kinase